MANAYVNKVVKSNGDTLIDISDTTAIASDVAQGKTLYIATGQKVTGTATGGTAAISVVDTTDSHGGTVRTITALDISDTTAVASDVAQGKYFYTASGVKTAGSASGSPSVTQHSIYLEFTDETDTTIPVYYNDSFVGSLITSTEPTTYGQKTVDSASLDGVEWYARPTGTWETIYENNALDYYPESDPTEPPYCWISSLGDIHITQGSTWRITFDGTTYSNLIATALTEADSLIGNPLYGPNRQDDGSGIPCAFYSTDWGAWSGGANVAGNTSHAVKIERFVTT